MNNSDLRRLSDRTSSLPVEEADAMEFRRAVRRLLETREGANEDGLDSFITWRELAASGAVYLKDRGQLFIGGGVLIDRAQRVQALAPRNIKILEGVWSTGLATNAAQWTGGGSTWAAGANAGSPTGAQYMGDSNGFLEYLIETNIYVRPDSLNNEAFFARAYPQELSNGVTSAGNYNMSMDCEASVIFRTAHFAAGGTADLTTDPSGAEGQARLVLRLKLRPTNVQNGAVMVALQSLRYAIYRA